MPRPRPEITEMDRDALRKLRRLVWKHGASISGAKLAAMLGVSPQYASKQLMRLEKHKLIRRYVDKKRPYHKRMCVEII